MQKVKSLVQIIACVCSEPNNSNNKDYRGRSTGPISRLSLSFSRLMMLFAPAISAGRCQIRVPTFVCKLSHTITPILELRSPTSNANVLKDVAPNQNLAKVSSMSKQGVVTVMSVKIFHRTCIVFR